MTISRPSDNSNVFDPQPDKEFDGVALTRWMKVWRLSAVDLAARLGITTQTLYNWRQSDTPMRAWVRLALSAIEREEEAKRVAARATNGGD